MKLFASFLTFALFATAPFQCAHDDPDKVERGHDTPSQALWDLSEQFAANGETAARNETLRRIVDRYPTSHEAELARQALGANAPSGGDSANAPAGASAPASPTSM